MKFDNRTYSTTPGMAGCQVIIKAGAYEIVILDTEGNHIITHRRLYGEEMESMIWLPYLELLSKRPTALKYTGIYHQLPSILKEYLDKNDYTGKKESLQLLTRMTVESDFHTAVSAFEEGLSYGVNDLDSIWATYCRLTTGCLPEPDITLSDTVPELKEYTPDMKIYDDLLLNSGVLP